MKKAVRRTLLILLLVIGIPLLLVVSCVVQIGAGYYHAAKDVSDNVAASVEQTKQHVTLTADGVSIAATLHKKPFIKLQGVMLCENGVVGNGVVGRYGWAYSSASSEIFMDDMPVPKSLTIRRMYNNQCVEQTIADTTPYILNRYETQIGIDQNLAKQLGIIMQEPTKGSTFHMSYSGNFDLGALAPAVTTLELPGTDHQSVTPAQHSVYTNITAMQVNQTIRLTFTYDNKPLQDEFMIGPKHVALQFSAP